MLKKRRAIKIYLFYRTLAKKSARNPQNKPLTVVDVRKKLTPKSVEIGSVKMLGQRMSIRIITSEYLKVQKTCKYKYEVISKKSKYRGNVDILFSHSMLRPGHSYYVQVNRDSRNPKTAKVFREIVKK